MRLDWEVVFLAIMLLQALLELFMALSELFPNVLFLTY
jgi:hypothetical protein